MLTDDDEDVPPAEPTVERPGTIESAGDDDLGITIAVPKGWEKEQSDEALRIASPDGSADVTVAHAGEGQKRQKALDAELAALEATYGSLEMINPAGGRSRQIGPYPAISAAVEVSDEEGAPLRLLLAAASTAEQTYLIAVRYPTDGSVSALTEAQAALSTLVLE